AARARLAVEAGCDGVVASGEEPAAIRQKVGDKLLIVTPGIRPAGKGADEHARVTTPTQAIKAGADYLVVGRPIRDASDPGAAVEAIVSEMQAAFDALKK
ncbi:MAG: orotidine 5'-phosphate decarboxylase / HUMPS family protein, partial [Nitrospiraceae bacterium]